MRRPRIWLGRAQLYNNIVTLHALMIIFFFVMPVLIGGFGNWLLPLILVSPDMMFPRVNNFRFWVLPPAVYIVVASAFIDEGIGTGWTMYPPLSTEDSHPGMRVDLVILALHLSGVRSTVAALNYLVSFINCRGKMYKAEYAPPFV